MRLSPPARHGHVPTPRRAPALASTTLFAAALLCLAAPAHAAPDTLHPSTWELAPDELQALGLGQSRGAPQPVPAEAPRLRWPGEPKAASQGRIFVNFGGAQLSSGWDDAQNDVTQINELAGNFAAYGEGAKRDAVMQAVRDDWAAYDVIITDSRPASGNYTMCMTGPTNPYGGGVLGIAPLDCDDSQTPNNIVYAFHSVNDSFDASTTATTIGQEAAHSFGLEHVDEPGDIMNPYNSGGDPSFTDQCIGIVGGVVCGSQHAAECGSQNQQNSHQELLTLFGASSPDAQNPVVSITSPSDGATFDVGASFEITVQASDDVGVEQVALFNNGEQIETDAAAPYGWTVNSAPAGTYEFYVEATDPSGNIATSNTVVVTVGDAPAGSTDGGSASGGSATGGSATGGDSGNPTSAGNDDTGGGDGAGDGAFDEGGDGSLPPGYGLDGTDTEGCACSQRGPADTALPRGLLAAVLLLGVRRRGRSRAI